jgi:hypothetical protein
MAKPHRLTGLASGDVDPSKGEAIFSLSVGPSNPIILVARYGVLSQITSALSVMLTHLRRSIQAQAGAMEPAAAETLAEIHIQKERWSDQVILKLVTVNQIEHTFVLSSDIAADIADRLKNESSKTTAVGTA